MMQCIKPHVWLKACGENSAATSPQKRAGGVPLLANLKKKLEEKGI